jgi:hypothetical protein
MTSANLARDDDADRRLQEALRSRVLETYCQPRLTD